SSACLRRFLSAALVCGANRPRPGILHRLFGSWHRLRRRRLLGSSAGSHRSLDCAVYRFFPARGRVMVTAPGFTAGTIYEGYAYSYPHKTAYRRFDQPVPVAKVWQEEPGEAIFLYIHIPFCEMRCGFCNLFTRVGAREPAVSRYLDKLEEHAEAARRAIPNPRFVRLAIGGGTPTYLDCDGLERTFDVAENIMGADVTGIPVSVEV